jgi:methylmalonyl-CoA/ethylmalonyl-CoA epimerase
MNVDHAGIATDDADALADLYADLFDAPIVHEERFGDLHVVFLDFGDSYFELLESVADGGEGDAEGTGQGPIARYLDRNGPGIHHLALDTEDVRAALDRAREHGIERIDEEPRPGAWGHDVAFLHPGSTGGVLIEFVEH